MAKITIYVLIAEGIHEVCSIHNRYWNHTNVASNPGIPGAGKLKRFLPYYHPATYP
jgi:hypothetical protein